MDHANLMSTSELLLIGATLGYIVYPLLLLCLIPIAREALRSAFAPKSSPLNFGSALSQAIQRAYEKNRRGRRR